MNDELPPEFDPLDYDNLTRHVVETLMRQPPVPLSDLARFEGAGVYALFYNGPLDIYRPISSAHAVQPIYVGKAVPSGGRKGLSTGVDNATLFNRLMDHKKSIDAAENLNTVDFLCRYLVVKPLWIVMAERFLITHYVPVWNALVDGFGNHDPGSRREGRRSQWDTLHPGRTAGWSAKVVDHHTEPDVRAKVGKFLAGEAVQTLVDDDESSNN